MHQIPAPRTPVLPWSAHWPQVEWRASVACYAPAHTCGWTPVPLFPVREPERRMSRTEEPISVREDRRESPWQETVLSRAASLWINESMEHHCKRRADLCVMMPWICPLSLPLCLSISLSVCLSVFVQGLFKGAIQNHPPCHERIWCAGLFVFISHAQVLAPPRAHTHFMSKCKINRYKNGCFAIFSQYIFRMSILKMHLELVHLI